MRRRLEAEGKIAHGWLHTERVRGHIRILALAEGVDPGLAELAALLHDVGRTQPGPESEHGARSATMAEPLLAELGLDDRECEQVLHAVRWHNSSRADTSLLCVLRDADMLDGLGAIGIMRALMSKSHLLPYDPAEPFEAEEGRWPARYSSEQIMAQMEWYDRLNTDAARRLAEDRFDFMAGFVAQARRELAVASAGEMLQGL